MIVVWICLYIIWYKVELVFLYLDNYCWLIIFIFLDMICCGIEVVVVGVVVVCDIGCGVFVVIEVDDVVL